MAAFARPPEVRSRPPPSNTAPEPPFHTCTDLLKVPLVRSFDDFAALYGRGGRRRGRGRPRRWEGRLPGTRGTARGQRGGRALALRALGVCAQYGWRRGHVVAWAPGGLRGPYARHIGARF